MFFFYSGSGADGSEGKERLQGELRFLFFALCFVARFFFSIFPEASSFFPRPLSENDFPPFAKNEGRVVLKVPEDPGAPPWGDLRPGFI